MDLRITVINKKRIKTNKKEKNKQNSNRVA